MGKSAQVNILFLANLSSQQLRRVRLRNNQVVEQEELFKSLNEIIRQVRTGPDGDLYFPLTQEKSTK